MISSIDLEATAHLPSLALMFLLGLRHGLDPDHVAMIDNMVFAAAERHPRLAPWTGSFFALGHSLAFGAIALAVSGLSGTITAPEWFGGAVDLMVFSMLVVIGLTNLVRLLRPGEFRVTGWRSLVLRKGKAMAMGPVAIILTGVLFGLVFDTVTQAAAWGAAATASGGLTATLALVASFASGMLIVDTLDSHIVVRVLRSMNKGGVERFRRATGWLIVTLSLGAAAYMAMTASAVLAEASDAALTGAGITAFAAFAALLAYTRLRRAGPKSPFLERQ